jgi:hypothetical protein
MDIESLLRESRAATLEIPLGFQTEIGKKRFQEQLRKFTPNIGLLQRRQQTILTLRESLNPENESSLEKLFEEVKNLEPHLQVFFEKTTVEKDSYEQLLFSGWKSFQVLNTVPFVLLCLSFFKQFIVPALAIMTPLFMILMPYILLRYMYKLHITPQQYTQILLGMFGLQTLDLKNPRTLLQGSLTLFSLGQSIYQPIQNAIHLQTVHKEMMIKAEAAQQLVSCMKHLEQLFPSFQNLQYSLNDLEEQELHQLFGTFWDNPYRLRLALSTVGDCEVIYRFANFQKFTPVSFRVGPHPFLQIDEGIDPFLQTSVPFQLHLDGATHHAILTGPNRGGKSSVLRSTLLNVLLAQTFGMGLTRESGKLQLRPFDWIATGLRLEDRPGSASMFESEVEFSIQILQKANQYPDLIGFVLFDELFHSTNPPDGARTADIFLQRLWRTPNTASFISTHVFDLAKKAHSHIQKLCVPAYKDNDGNLVFTYTLQKGICEVSSVDVILREKGLLQDAEKSTPENQKQ